MKSEITVVTCFGPGGWDLYAKKMVQTFVKHWPKDVKLKVYHHDAGKFKPVKAPNVEYRDLIALDSNVRDFKAKYNAPHFKGQGPNGEYNYRYDAIKFCHKVFALGHLAADLVDQNYGGWLVWLDGDTFTTADAPRVGLETLLPEAADVVHLPRRALPYSETSFLGFNFVRKRAVEFLGDLVDTYVDGELFNHREWHDGWIFSRLLSLHRLHGLVDFPLTPPDYQGIDAFENSVLSKFMTHLKGNRKAAKGTKTSVTTAFRPLKIIPRDSMPKEHIIQNVNASAKYLKRWLKRCIPHKHHAVIVSAGLSLKKNLPKIKRLQRAGAYVFCVKHALPILMEAGIVPYACVVLDPRPVDKESTHGVVRATLFDKVDPKTKFFIASMTDTSVTRHILTKTDNVYGWLAWTAALKGTKPPAESPIIVGGTCTAWRLVGVVEALGFRKLTLFGYDFHVDPAKIDKKAKDELGREKYFPIFLGEGKNRRKWWTTGELAAGVQDTEEMFRRVMEAKLDVRVIGDGPAPHRWAKYAAHNKKLLAKWKKASKGAIKPVSFAKEFK